MSSGGDRSQAGDDNLGLTPAVGCLKLASLRPPVSAELDRARARGRVPLGPGEPSRFPGEPPIFVGSSGHAANIKLLQRLQIGAVLNCAPSVCKDPKKAYAAAGIAYAEVNARDDRSFPLLKVCLPQASTFIAKSHAAGRAVLVHCMAGVNRSATLALAHLLLRDRRNLFEVFAECIAARPSILQNASFQLQLCELAAGHGLLLDSSQPTVIPHGHESPEAVSMAATRVPTRNGQAGLPMG